MRNTWISEHRHRTCQPVCQELPADDQNEVGSDDPDPVLRLTGHATWAKFASLPAHHREVVLAVDVGGLSYDEAAIALAIPVGTVMSRLYRARRRLASLLPAA
jgi:RNA polymerase sigma-70 factor (ECF subfamily)